MKSILITTSTFSLYNEKPLRILQESGFRLIFNPYQRKLTENEVLDLVQKVQPEGIIAGVEPLTRKVLESAKYLKVVSRCGVGLDSVDLAAADDLSIRVLNTPDASSLSVAELTLGLIFAVLRKIPMADSGIRRGKWLRPMGRVIAGKVVGIIGCGRIGCLVGRMLSLLECCVIGFDPYQSAPEHIERHSLGEVLRQADIVSLHLPFNRETQGMFDREKIFMMKDGSCLINTSRGGLVDEKVLFEALQSGKLAGAALDCFVSEPYDGRLRELDNVVLTSHIGSYAIEGRIQMEIQATENLLRELKKDRKTSWRGR